jgi:spermidine/putrescine transport system substrate-binding protein
MTARRRDLGTPIDRRTMLRGALALSAAGGLGGVLAACGSSGSSASSSSTAAAASSGPAGIAAKKDGSTLDLFAWQGYFAPSTISGFEKQYGITVNQTYITSGDDELQKVVAGLPFDVAIANSENLSQIIAAGLLRPLDHANLSNWSQVSSYFNNPYYDPGAKYSVGYAMAPLGIVYRTDVFPSLTGSWSDMWNFAAKAPGRVYMLDDMQISLSIALMHLGLPINNPSQSDLNAAADALLALKPKLAGFVSVNTIQTIASGQAAMMPTYTGNVYTALSQAKNPGTIKFELCQQGQLFNSDTMTITSKAAHPGNGMLFINYMLAAANMTANVDYIGYPVGTAAGLSSYTTLVKDHPWLGVGTDLLSKPSAWEQGLSETERPLWTSAWLKVQS